MTTVEKMNATGSFYRFRGIMDCLEKKTISDEEITLLKKLCGDSAVICGRMIKNYAEATLDFLKIVPYTGHDEDTRKLIMELKKS